MWSFVANKKNKHWVWLALDIETKEIVGVYIGERSRHREHRDYGALYLHYIGSVLCVIPICGLPTMRFFLSLGIKLLARRAVKLT